MGGMDVTPATTPHERSIDEIADALEVDPRAGLSTAEVERRQASFGPNELEAERGPGLWRIVLGAATEPFVLLLVASGIGAVLLGEVRDGLLILAGVVPIVGADALTEYRGEHALEALRAASAPHARVRRDGHAAV